MQSGIWELAKRGTLPASQKSPHAEQNRASNMLKIHPPALHMLIFPGTFYFQNQKVLLETPGSQVVYGGGHAGSSLLPTHLAGKSVQHRSRWARQPWSRSTCLPRQARCLPAKAGHPAVPLEQEASWQLAGCWSRAALCPWSSRSGRVGSGGSQTWWPPTLGTANELGSFWAWQLGTRQAGKMAGCTSPNLTGAFWISPLKNFLVGTSFAPEFLTCSVWDFSKDGI